MINKTEAQPEALRLELHQECADFATSLRSASNVVQLRGQKAPPSFLKAADLFEQAAAEIQQLKAERDLRAVERDGANERVRLMLNAKNQWMDRAKAAEAQLSARQAAPDGPWKCGNEYLPYHPDASHVDPAYRDGWNDCYRAAPPPPEREPLTLAQIDRIGDATGKPSFTWHYEFARAIERAHGIGATNDNP